MTLGKPLQAYAGWWTYDAEAGAYYFAPVTASDPPFTTQRHVEAVLDIAADGTLAGVELVYGDLPPPPKTHRGS